MKRIYRAPVTNAILGRREQKERRMKPEVKCAFCHGPVTPQPHSGRPRRFCSARCRWNNKSKRYNAERRVWVAIGARPVAEIATFDPQQGWHWNLPLIVPCDVCRKVYIHIGYGGHYCSDECRVVGAVNTRRRSDQKRSAVRRGADTIGRVTARQVYERDGWMCGICHKPIDKALRYPDPMSASLDHVVPVSYGGEHTESNSQAAHLQCNSSRRNSLRCLSAAQMMSVIWTQSNVCGINDMGRS